MKAYDGCFLDRAIHSLNLAVCPRMPHLREAVFDPVLAANAVEDVRKGVRIQGPVGELKAVVGQHGVDPVGRRLQQVAQELRRLQPSGHGGRVQGWVGAHAADRRRRDERPHDDRCAEAHAGRALPARNTKATARSSATGHAAV